MTNLRKHTDALKIIIGRSMPSDDFPYTSSFLSHMLYVVGNKAMKDKADKEGSLSEFNYTTFCIDLIDSTFSECSCVEQKGCVVKRSKIKIPRALLGQNDIKILNFNGEHLDNITPSIYKYSKYAVESEKYTGWLIHNDYLFIIGDSDIEHVLLKTIITDLDDLNKFNTCEANDANLNSGLCVMLENAFKIDDDLIENVYNKTLRLLGYNFNTPFAKDTKSDNYDNTTASNI